MYMNVRKQNPSFNFFLRMLNEKLNHFRIKRLNFYFLFVVYKPGKVGFHWM